jgi:DNA-binding transcriptional ArsR family regulator
MTKSLIETKALKALGDPTRIRAVLALKKHTLCVCQIVELLKLSPSTISKHLQILLEAGLVENEKRGRWVYYSFTTTSARGVPEEALNLILDTAKKSDQAKKDRARLKEIRCIDPEILCTRQNKR